MNTNIKVWVITAKFPNTIQPWLANIVSQIPRNGGDVQVFSLQKGDRSYASVVDEYGLVDKVIYLRLEGWNNLITAYRNFLNPSYIVRSLKGIFSYNSLGRSYSSIFKKILSKVTLAPFLIKTDVDIIHSHSEPAGYKLLPIIQAQRVPFVITFHGLPPVGVTKLTDQMRSEYTSLASIILVNTEFAKSQYKKLGADVNKIRILPQGTDTRKFIFKEKSFPKDGVIRILTVGRFSKDKGQEFAIEAIADLIKENYKIEYTLIGQGLDKDRLIQRVKELNIEKHVIFKSGLTESDIIKIYQESHIFVLPSLRAYDGFHEETQGVVIQEAQSTGSIVVATRTGGIPECVVDGETGFLVEDRNSIAIQDKIEWIINNPHKWIELQTKSRASVEKNYDIDVIGIKLMNLYKELLS